MKITHNKIGQQLNLTDAGKADKAGDAKVSNQRGANAADALAEASDATRVDVSTRAQDAKKIKELAMAAPDVDMEKVARFRSLIDSGNYKVDAQAVADRMVDDHLETKN
jgi:negative regulator of flagellin synthesis FlgM